MQLSCTHTQTRICKVLRSELIPDLKKTSLVPLTFPIDPAGLLLTFTISPVGLVQPSIYSHEIHHVAAGETVFGERGRCAHMAVSE